MAKFLFYFMKPRICVFVYSRNLNNITLSPYFEINVDFSKIGFRNILSETHFHLYWYLV